MIYYIKRGLWLWIFLFACSQSTRSPQKIRELVLFPSPPDTARIQYLTTFSSSKDLLAERSSFLQYVMGEEQEKVIQKPYGMSVQKDRIYICDTMLPGLEIIDLKARTFDYFIPDGPGELKKPINCFIDFPGHLYVADTERRQIVVFSSAASFLFVLGDGKNGKPTDVMVYDNKIWVCDYELRQITVYDKNTRKEMFSFPAVEKDDPAYLFGPTNFSIKNDVVYVTDTGAAVIKKFSTRGEFLGEIGSRGNLIGQFVRPKGIAVDNNRNTYIVDTAFENVQIFNPQDNLLMYFGGTYKKQGYMWLPAGVVIDYDNVDYFKDYVNNSFDLQYLIFVSNQYGPDKINVYGFVNPKGID